MAVESQDAIADGHLSELVPAHDEDMKMLTRLSRKAAQIRAWFAWTLRLGRCHIAAANGPEGI